MFCISIGDREGEGIWLGNLGYVSVLLSRYRQAFAYYDKTLGIARASGDDAAEGRCLGNLGSICQSIGEYPRAITYFDSALIIARDTGDRVSEGIWLGNLGNAYYPLAAVSYLLKTTWHKMLIYIN